MGYSMTERSVSNRAQQTPCPVGDMQLSTADFIYQSYVCTINEEGISALDTALNPCSRWKPGEQGTAPDLRIYHQQL